MRSKLIATVLKKVEIYNDKYNEIIFENENGIKQGDKQLERKYEIKENYWNNLIKACAKLTEEEFDSLQEINDLCISYEDMLEENKYLY